MKKNKKALSIACALVVNLFLFITAFAQSKNTPVAINDQKIADQINKSVRPLHSNQAYAATHLYKSRKDLEENKCIKIPLPKPHNRLLKAEEIYEMCGKGTISIGVSFKNADSITTAMGGSGVIVSDQGICVTNYHVLAGLLEKDMGRGSNLLGFMSTIDGKVYPITAILTFSKQADVVVFKVDAMGDHLTAIPFGLPAKTGAKVHLITHPDGRHYFYTEGVVARNSINENNIGAITEVMEITADFATGSSGGPVLDSYGNLAGIVWATKPVYYEAGESRVIQMMFKETIPVRVIKKLFESNRSD